MKTILHEIKNFRRLSNLNEDVESPVKVALIGDSLIDYLESDDFISLPNLVDDDMTIDKLLNKLTNEEPMPDVDHVFVSIGVNDKFKNKKNIPFLIDILNKIFPKANINIIKGIVDEDYFYGGEDKDDFKMLEDESKSFYNTFTKNGTKVLGSYDSIDYGLGFSDNKINNLKNEIDKALFQNVTDFEFDDEPKKEDLPFIQKDNIDISGEDVTDFDTIYEFLERFQEMWKSGNVYDSRSSGSFKPDIEQIQLALNFLSISDDLEITGKFDRDTQEAIYNYQKSVNLPETGIADSETLEEMFFNLKIKGFDDEDLSMFLIKMGVISNVVSLLNGKVEIVGLGGEERQNAQIMIDYMNKKGITNPYTQVGILCVIGKESGFIPQNEIGYGNTDNSRIREIFKSRVPSDDKVLDELKLDDEKFFNQVYGGMFGNSKTEGFKYRGRGFNGLTFKGNYEKYGTCIGRELVSNPEVVNDVDIAAEVAVSFFTKCKSADQLPEFTNEDDAINYFVDLNAGGTGTDETRGNAFNQLSKFEIVA
jgi:predicted chitinase